MLRTGMTATVSTGRRGRGLAVFSGRRSVFMAVPVGGVVSWVKDGFQGILWSGM
jgi:hypothetical protein